MSKKEAIEKRTEEALLKILEESGFELWDVEYVRERDEWFLRAYIDKEGGITIDDCVDVSGKLSDVLDEDNIIPDAYTLEVSSPGLGRKLVKDREFERSIGRDVDVKFYRQVDGTKEVTGKLEAFDKDTVTLRIEQGNSPPKQTSFARGDIATVRLSVDF